MKDPEAAAAVPLIHGVGDVSPGIQTRRLPWIQKRLRRKGKQGPGDSKNIFLVLAGASQCHRLPSGPCEREGEFGSSWSR